MKTVRPPAGGFRVKAPARFPGWMLYHSLPMVADTWGISGGSFLALYAGIAAAVFAGTWLLCRALARAPVSANGLGSASGGALTPEEVALLRGGPPLAVTVAALDLRSGGALEPLEGHRGRMRAAGSGPPSGNPLAGALWDAVATAGRPVWAPQLRRQLAHGPVMAEMRSDLRRRGLLLSSSVRRAIRALGLLPLAVIALGVARLVAGSSNGKPVGYLTLELCAVVAGWIWLLVKSPRQSDAGRKALAAVERARPSTGRGDAAMSVALSGTGVLWASDPAFAQGWGVPVGSGGSSGFWGGGASGGSGGCGGGGGGGGGGCGG